MDTIKGLDPYAGLHILREFPDRAYRLYSKPFWENGKPISPIGWELVKPNGTRLIFRSALDLVRYDNNMLKHLKAGTWND